MNSAQLISKSSLGSSKLFVGTSAQNRYIWDNLIIEKRISVNWLYELYKASILRDFWSVLSSPAN